MPTISLRQLVGAPLTNTQIDNNFVNIANQAALAPTYGQQWTASTSVPVYRNLYVIDGNEGDLISAGSFVPGKIIKIKSLGNTDWNTVAATSGTFTANTGGVASTTLTVTAVSAGSVQAGQYLTGTGITSGTYITAIITGSGGAGTYQLSQAATIAAGGTNNVTGAVTYTVGSRILVVNAGSGTGNATPAIRVYQVSTAGTTGTTPPTHVTGSATNGTAVLDYVSARAVYDSAEILAKLITVDGTGSGLDADLLDGLNTSSTDTTGNSVVTRSSGNFSAGTITAGTITGLNSASTKQIVLNGSSSGAITLTPPASAGTTAITIPATAGTLITTGDSKTIVNAMIADTTIANAKLANPSATISLDGTNTATITLGSTTNLYTNNWVWTGTHSFKDANLTIIDDVDATKKLQLQLSNITTGNTRTITIPDASGTMALQSYVATYVQTTGQNSQGLKTISTSTPSGGSNGDIWYQY